MKIAIFQAPYDSGHHARRMGRGPLHLVEQGLVERLQSDGHEVDVQCLELADGFLTEVGTAAELQRRSGNFDAAHRADLLAPRPRCP